VKSDFEALPVIFRDPLPRDFRGKRHIVAKERLNDPDRRRDAWRFFFR